MKTPLSKISFLSDILFQKEVPTWYYQHKMNKIVNKFLLAEDK